MQITYLAFEHLSSSPAAHAHVMGIADGLRSDVPVTLITPTAPRAYWSCVRRLWRAQDNGVVYVRWHPAFVLTLPIIWLRQRRAALVLELNGPPSDFTEAYPAFGRFQLLVQLAFRVSLRSARGVITNTYGLAEYVRRQPFRGHIEVIPPGLDVDQLPAGIVDMRQRRAVFVGSLTRWQGIETLLAAVGNRHWPADLELVIAGDGPLRERVEAAAASDSRIRYLGRVERGQAVDLLAHAAVSLSPKEYQLDAKDQTGLFPFKVIESLAMGTPVVATAVPDQDALVATHGLGVVVPMQDPMALAKAVTTSAAQEIAHAERTRVASDVRDAHSWKGRVAITRRMLSELVDD